MLLKQLTGAAFESFEPLHLLLMGVGAIPMLHRDLESIYRLSDKCLLRTSCLFLLDYT